MLNYIKTWLREDLAQRGENVNYCEFIKHLNPLHSLTPLNKPLVLSTLEYSTGANVVSQTHFYHHSHLKYNCHTNIFQTADKI